MSWFCGGVCIENGWISHGSYAFDICLPEVCSVNLQLALQLRNPDEKQSNPY